MSFQFCCPQGHVLQGDMSQVGQLFQCPVCGCGFIVPPPDAAPVAGSGFLQGPGAWQGANAPLTPYPMQAPQPQPASPTGSPDQESRPGFDLGFDPGAKTALPFDLPGTGELVDGEAEAAAYPNVPQPDGAYPAAASPQSEFLAGPFPSAAFTVPSAPLETSGEGQDFLKSAPAAGPECDESASPPKLLHFRCPSGHIVKAGSDLLGKNGRCPACKKTFELRYEDSIEFRRRKENILRREEIKAGRTWIAWAFAVAFFVFAALAAIVVHLSR